MNYIRALVAVALLLLPSVAVAQPAMPIDRYVTLTSAADIPGRRADVYQMIFGSPQLPTTQSQVDVGIPDPFAGWGFNVARVDRFVANMQGGETVVDYLYWASEPNVNRLAVINFGHQTVCNYPSFPSFYEAPQLIQRLLDEGFSVYTSNMPGCGPGIYTAHPILFTNYGNIALRYFFQPIVWAINYLEANHPFVDYSIAGLSGGGWTADVTPAVDLRFKTGIGFSGNYPGLNFIGAWNSDNDGECQSALCWGEGSVPDFVSLVGLRDLYIMSAYGQGRFHQQVMIRRDDCCYGEAQWLGLSVAQPGVPKFNFRDYYNGTAQCRGANPCRWATYLAAYSQDITEALANIQPAVNPPTAVDEFGTSHQISWWGRNKIMAVFQGNGPEALPPRNRKMWW